MTTCIKSMVNCRYLLLCMLCILMGACESLTTPRLSQGLVQETDFTGQWTWQKRDLPSADEPADSRYSQMPATETLRRGLIGESEKQFVMVVHALRRYAQPAPDLGDFPHDTTIGGSIGTTLGPSGTAFDLDVVRLGNSTRGRCVQWNSGSFPTYCVVEIRYTHILSTLGFDIDNNASKADIEQSLNEALSHIDARVKEIDLQLSTK